MLRRPGREEVTAPLAGEQDGCVAHGVADPLRLRLFEELLAGPRSARELAEVAELPPDRLYYHLRRLEQAGLVEIAEYRRLAGGKVERIYRTTDIEPPGDDVEHQDTARFVTAVLDATQADLSAAFSAKQDGRRREVLVSRATLRLSESQFASLRDHLAELVQQNIQAENDEPPVRVLFAMVDLRDRP